MEKIIHISEVDFVQSKEMNYPGRPLWNREIHFEGYQIITDEQKILIGIESGQSCCEFFGYITSEDDLSVLIGQELLRIELVDTALKTYNLSKYEILEEGKIGDAVFVNVVTPQDVVQFVVYNFHNGYYGHDVCIRSTQLNHDEVL